jgi:16S rRNA processing protein RimM
VNHPETKLLEAGRVGRAHGLDGSFYVTKPVTRLLAGETPITLAGRRLAIVRRSGTEKHPILRLAGMTRREDAEALRGQPLLVELAHAPALERDEYWSHDLKGCEVRDGERLIGVVEELIGLPSCEALLVKRSDGGELLVPMVKDAILEVDLTAGHIEIDLNFLGET